MWVCRSRDVRADMLESKMIVPICKQYFSYCHNQSVYESRTPITSISFISAFANQLIPYSFIVILSEPLQLSSITHAGKPRRSHRRPKFSIRLASLDPIITIQCTCRHDIDSRECLVITTFTYWRTAVSAKGDRELNTRGGLREGILLGRARSDLVRILGYKDVSGVGATTHFLTLVAVAERLLDWLFSDFVLDITAAAGS